MCDLPVSGYYQLGGLDRALAVGLAFLLLMTTESKLQNLELSILHGDRAANE